MEIRQYINVLLKWWWLIVASVIVAAASSYLYTRQLPLTYQSQTTLMVGQVLQNPNPNQNDFFMGQALAQSYADLARREPVLRGVLQSLGLQWDWNTLKDMVASQVIAGTQLIQIDIVDTDAQRAKVLADEVARQLILQTPSGTDPQAAAEHQFVVSQVDELRTNITKAKDEMHRLDGVIANATSARQIQDARTQQGALQTQIATWQSTYAQLLTNLQVGVSNYLSVVEPAQIPAAPVGPHAAQTVALAAAIGFVLAGGAAFLIEFIDDTIKSPDDVRRILDLPTLGNIANLPDKDYPGMLVSARHPRSPVTEAFRVLRTNLQFSAVGRPLGTLIVTSTTPREGKSMTAANMAVVMAQAGKRVILVDADLRRPTLHLIFGLANNIGLTTALVESDVSMDSVLRRTSVPGLRVLTSGLVPPNPAELLGSERMLKLIAMLREQADVTIFDSPPVLAVTDAILLAAHVDGVVLVLSSGRVRQALAVRAKESLVGVHAHIIGAIVNRKSGRQEGYYQYYAQDKDKPRSSIGRRLSHGQLLQIPARHGKRGKTPLAPESMPRPTDEIAQSGLSKD